MNGDIRISTNMINHTKVKKLIKKHGYEAFYSLICFWSYVAINKPDGNISGLDADDIEIASNWGGDDGVLYDAFCYLGFLDCEGENVCIHNWTKHNPYAVGAEGRSLEAKKKQFVRWGCKKLPKKQHDNFKEWLYDTAVIDTNSNTDSILAVYKVYTQGNTPYPVPDPVPDPVPTTTVVFEDWYKHYPKKQGRAKAEESWNKLKVDDSLLSEMLSSLEKQKTSIEWTKNGGQFIPFPSTYLNGKRWEDEVTTSFTYQKVLCPTCAHRINGLCNKGDTNECTNYSFKN